MQKWFVLLLVLLACGCKRKDKTNPVVSIALPLAQTHLSAGDSFDVQASISDDRNLDYVEVQLLDENLQPAAAKQYFELDEATYELETTYSLEGFEGSSGSYQLRVRADDGSNQTNEFVELFIEGYAVQRAGLVVVSDGGQSTNIHFIDRNLAISELSSISHDFAGSAVLEGSSQLVVGGRFDPEISAVNLNSGGTAWAETLPSNLPFSRYEHLQQYNGIAFASDRTGWVRGYDANGNAQYTSQMQTGWYPLYVYEHNDVVLVVEHAVSGSNLQLATYWRFSGELRHSVALPLESAVAIASLEFDEVLIFGSDQSQPTTLVYNIGQNDFTSVFAVPQEPILCAVGLNQREFLIGTAQALYVYNHDDLAITELPGTEGGNLVVLDALTEEVLVVKGFELRAYDLGSLSEKYSVALPVEAAAIDVWLED